MMKKRNIKLFFLLICMLVFIPLTTNAAATYKTLGDMKAGLSKLQAEKSVFENKKKQTESEIRQNQSNVKSANDEIVNAKNKIASLTDDIKTNEEKVKNLKEETTQLLIVYQKLSTENVYVKYITGSKSMSEIIMRIDAIKQLTDYNNKKINEMEQLVVSNKKMQKELAEYQVKLDQRITDYQSKISNLGDNLRDLVEEYEGYDSQISGLKQSISYFANLGCKDTQLFTQCAPIYDTPGWTRPVSSGIITSAWGFRIHPIKGTYTFHNGVDIGIREGTTVYSAANGRVSKINYRNSCGGNMVYVEVNVMGREYTLVYMHLLSINVRVNEIVNVNTVIGESGGGSTRSYDRCTTGAHLHYGVSTGHYPGKISYSTYIANSINPPNFPAKGARFYSR